MDVGQGWPRVGLQGSWPAEFWAELLAGGAADVTLRHGLSRETRVGFGETPAAARTPNRWRVHSRLNGIDWSNTWPTGQD
jgi:hypothetical protein